MMQKTDKKFSLRFLSALVTAGELGIDIQRTLGAV